MIMDLATIQAAHQQWLAADSTGKRADFRNADLRWQSLDGRCFNGATLRGADLTHTSLRGGQFDGCDFTMATMFVTQLADASCVGADFSGAACLGADFERTNLTGANFTGAALDDASFKFANLTGAKFRGVPLGRIDINGCDVPVVEGIHQRMYEAIMSPGCRLDVRSFDRDENTHDRAGWAIVLAGDLGRRLAEVVGPCAAGSLIYAASDPRLPVPDFYCDARAAWADIKRLAGKAVG